MCITNMYSVIVTQSELIVSSLTTKPTVVWNGSKEREEPSLQGVELSQDCPRGLSKEGAGCRMVQGGCSMVLPNHALMF